MRHDTRGFTRARHPSLIEDQHRPPRAEAALVVVEVQRQPRQRPRLADAGLLGELPHGASRRRRSQDAIARGRVGLGEQAGREGLAGPRQRLDRLHPVTARRQPTDHPGLLGRRRVRRVRQDRLDERRVEAARALAATRLGAVHDRLLMGEQIARREPPLSQTAGAVHVVASQELRCGALDRVCRCPLPVRGRPRHHHLAPGERVLSLG